MNFYENINKQASVNDTDLRDARPTASMGQPDKQSNSTSVTEDDISNKSQTEKQC